MRQAAQTDVVGNSGSRNHAVDKRPDSVFRHFDTVLLPDVLLPTRGASQKGARVPSTVDGIVSDEDGRGAVVEGTAKRVDSGIVTCFD